jgi:hypothetical protein
LSLSLLLLLLMLLLLMLLLLLLLLLPVVLLPFPQPQPASLQPLPPEHHMTREKHTLHHSDLHITQNAHKLLSVSHLHRHTPHKLTIHRHTVT